MIQFMLLKYKKNKKAYYKVQKMLYWISNEISLKKNNNITNNMNIIYISYRNDYILKPLI